jgi:ATP phosphoribosyltransferase regulatory subunit
MPSNNVSPADISLPKGVKDFLPLKAGKIVYLRQTLLDIFSRWGFRPVIPPSMEYLNVLERGLGKALQDKTVRFDDRQSGQLVSFTPDITPQVARIVATRMREMPLPLRLSYYGRVLRHEEQ